MNRLILSVSIPALLLAACASAPAEDAIYGLAPDMVQGPLEPMAPVGAPPHFPADLTPVGGADAGGG
ncbi:MAG: hypothetical protein QME55_10260, partial [Brevundimonas sp.]|uniref:hypothetical protein n=1 Tax=Brevundimonas sp. TaxID=1871086 RepID=UPI00261F136D